jgi:diguanylate cyclase (GGDEF)-like protein
MPDRHGGDAVEGADVAPVSLVPGLPADVVRRWLVPGYLITILAFLWVNTPVVPPALGLPLGQLVPSVISLVLLRGAWVARRSSHTVVERRFWSFLAAGAFCLLAGEWLYVAEVVSLHGAEPPLASLSTAFDVLAALLLLGLLASLARFREATWAARARFLIDIAAACVVFVGILDDLVVGSAMTTAAAGGFPGALYSAYPVIGALLLAGTLRVVIGTHYDRWKSWERRIGAAAAAFAFALLLTPVGYSDFLRRATGGWASIAVDGLLLTGLCLALAAVVHRLADHGSPWRLRPMATLEPSYGWLASVVLPSIELLAIPVFGIAAFQTDDPAERVFRLTIVGLVSLALAVRTLLAVADSEALLTRADTDPLTGLLNHRMFRDRLSDEIARATRHGESVGLVTLDVDDFGAVNSVGGHLAGDRVLVELAVAVGAAVRSQDVVCRVGGDELTVILPGADLGSAFVTARRILDGVRTVSDSIGRPLTASAGVAACPEHAPDRTRLVAAADAALYWAKRHGKDRAVIYDAQVVDPATPEQRIRDLREQANLEAVRALAAAVDARDPGTQDHSRNVAALAADLARHIGMDEETVTLMGFAGQLHDVGKIGVPDAVLRKRETLTPEERSRLREHAPLGAQILASTSMLAILPWVRHHHERWDGSGHPDGLAGERIALGARIIAICEAYDSLVSGRFGRKPQTPRAALQQIDLDLGGKFDPVTGEQFILMMAARAGEGADDGGAS